MNVSSLKKEFKEAQQVLNEFLLDDSKFEQILLAAEYMVEALKNNNKIISCGNGGSMCDAMHFAEELSGRYRENRPGFAAIAISDPSHITCVANDFGFDHVFSRYIEAVGKSGDVLLAISTSGNSPNIVAAIQSAHCRGMKVIGLTGKNGGAMATRCDVEIRVPHFGYSDRIQEIHIKIIHSLIHIIERRLVL
ncbi:MAG TPA: D-sedoheptulose 7-phosphate isomerase [Bacteroidales bacterium]|nr:D-sedoheptulose 7-phosphate isomerase [Bacteroidales bacterium]